MTAAGRKRTFGRQQKKLLCQLRHDVSMKKNPISTSRVLYSLPTFDHHPPPALIDLMLRKLLPIAFLVSLAVATKTITIPVTDSNPTSTSTFECPTPPLQCCQEAIVPSQLPIILEMLGESDIILPSSPSPPGLVGFNCTPIVVSAVLL